MRTQMVSMRWWAASMLLASMTYGAPTLAQNKGVSSTAPKAAPAASAPATAAAESSEKEADRLYDDGVKAAKAGSWEKARVSMVAAFKLKPGYAWAANLGRVELMAGKPRDAAEHLTFFLREAPKIEPEDRAAVEKMLGDAKAQIGTATIQVNAPGAQLLVDGQPVGTAPLALPVFVEVGSRQFEAKKDGMLPASKELLVTAGSAPTVELKLTNEAAPATSTRAVLGAPVETGSSRNKTLIYSGIGLSAGLVAVGIATAIGAVATNAESENYLQANGARVGCSGLPACVEHYNGLQDRYSALGSASIYTFIGAGLLGSGIAIYALTGSRQSANRHLSATVTPQSAWISMSASW